MKANITPERSASKPHPEPLVEGFIRGILGIGLTDDIEEARETLRQDLEARKAEEGG